MVTVIGGWAPGCSAGPIQPSRIAFGQSFELRAGASAVLTDGLTIVFDRVKSDSRCPADAICISAGDAVVALAISRPGEARAERDVHSDSGGSRVTYLTYTIRLEALAPYPLASRPTRPEDYVAKLTVTN